MSEVRHAPALMVVPAIPTEVAGTSIVVRRLVQNLGSDEVVILGRGPNRHARLESAPLAVPAVKVWWPPLGLRGERFWRVLGAPPWVLQGIHAIRTRRIGSIVAMFPDDGSLLAGYLLHRATGLPLLAYFCDLYMEDRSGSGWEARFARWLQPRVFRAAARILAVNQGMTDYYRERYGIDALHLPTCINHPVPSFVAPPAPRRPFRIGYSGNINEMRVDSLQALVRALGDDPNYVLHYFTPQKPAYLKSLGVWARHTEVEFVADENALIEKLARCDVLFLPLTFLVQERARDQMATCFGVKSYEYFLAQRPILVHCPGDYFLARFYRERGCGLVVEDPSPEALLAGLRRLRETGDLRDSLVRRGLDAARQFDGPSIALRFRAELARVAALTPGS